MNEHLKAEIEEAIRLVYGDIDPIYGVAEIADEIMAAVEKLHTPKWRSIDSAPKDGTEILGYEDGVRYTCKYDYNAWELLEWGEHACGGNNIFPTHWMPLPEAPKEVK